MSLLDDAINGRLTPSDLVNALRGILRQMHYAERTQHIPMLSPARHRAEGVGAPDVVVFGTLITLQFTPDTDRAYRTVKFPTFYKPGTSKFHIHWTKTGDVDESGKAVRWRLEYTVFDGKTMNVANGVTGTLEVEDTYDDNAADASRIVHRTPDVEIPDVPAGYYMAIKVSAVTPVGTALAGEPCLSSVDFTWVERINEDPAD